MLYPDGSQDRYTLAIREQGQTPDNGYRMLLYRTEHLDPAGRTNTFVFTTNQPSGTPLVRLSQVKDSDRNFATLSYGSSVPNLVTQVTDPFGRTATLAYDSNGLLTNIVDAVGMSSSFTYDSMGVKTLTTPYGTNTFTLYEESGTDGGNVAGMGRINRAALIAEPEGATQLYIYSSNLNQYDPLLADLVPEMFYGGFATNLRPELPFAGTTFDVGEESSMWDHPNYGGAVTHNSYYWGRKQASALSTTNFLSLSTNDFRISRLKHWLIQPDRINVTSALSHEIAPSPDGTGVGAITWYDYPGKATNYLSEIGTSLQPSIIAQRMPGGPTWWVQLQYNSLGLVTQTISSYTKLDGTTGTRTNSIGYVNNVYPSFISKTDGSRDWGIGYNSRNQIQYVTNALGDVTTAQYDSTSHKLIDITFPNGLDLQLVWAGTLSQVIAAGYSTNIFTWSNGQIQTLTDTLGLTRTFTYDGLDRLIKVDYPDGTYETNQYSRLDLVGTIDRLGATNLFGYNRLGQMTSATDALGAVTHLNRCVCGLLDSIVTPLGQTYSFLYDHAGRLVQKSPPASSPVWLQYDHYGRLTNSYDMVSSFSLAYNNQGRVTNVWNGLGNLWTGVYDVEDRLVRSTNRNGIGSTNTFDALNRVLTTTWPDGGVEKVFYATGSQAATAYTNQIGQIQLMGFDALQRLISQAVPGVFTNTFAYNGASLITNLLDGNGHQTAWVYDTYGRAIQKKDNSGNLVWTNGYNANGWLTKRYTPAKGLATFSYNILGRLTNAAFPTSPTQSYTYDAQSRLTSMTDAVGTSGFSYNAFGALNSEDGPWSNDTLNYTYTLTRLRSGLVLQQPSGVWGQNYQYDAANRLTSTASGAGTFVYDYLTSSGNNPSLVSKVTMPSGGYVQQGFDSVGRMQSTALKNSGGTTLDSRAYVFDQAGQRTKTTYTLGNYWDFTYDNAGELLTAAGKGSGGSSHNHELLSYGYDSGGNLLYRTNNALIQAFSVDGQNQLSSVSSSGTLTVAGNVNSTASSVNINGSAATLWGDKSFSKTGQSFATGVNTYTAVATETGTGTTATTSSSINIPASSPFGYDLNGNLVSDGQRQFDYDDQDQLTRVTVGIASRSEFTYDGLSRKRIAKEYGASLNGTAAMISVSSLAPTTRNNYSGWVGSQITVLTRAVLVSDLGRWVKSGNTQSHTVKLVVASTGADVPGASVTIATAGATAGQFAYGTLPVPVMLNPNTTYYLVSQEVNGGDSWYEYTNSLTVSGGISIPGVVTGTGGTYTTTTAANQGYGPVGLKGVTANAMLSATSLSGTRNNVNGWVGCRITVGSDPLAVTELARWVATSNVLTHVVKLVRAVDGVDVAGAQVTVNNSGVSSGHLLYGTLPSPVVLEANTTYYLVSQETSGGDLWYDSGTTVSALTGVTVPGAILYSGSSWTAAGSSNNAYGPMGFKAVPVTWSVAKETRYVYDGMLVIQERNASNTPQVSYIRGKDLSGGLQGAGGIGGILAQTTSANVSQYYHADGLGNVTALLNVNNQLSATYNYDPYGNLLSSSGPMADLNPYRFSSKEFHGASGTYAYGYRHYDPNLQRWLNRDPMGAAGGINAYGFAGNRPLAAIDPFGLCDVETAAAAAVAGTAALKSLGLTAADIAAAMAARSMAAAGIFNVLNVSVGTAAGAVGGAAVGGAVVGVAAGGFAIGYLVGEYTPVGDWLADALAPLYDNSETSPGGSSRRHRGAVLDEGQWEDGDGRFRGSDGQLLPDQNNLQSLENKEKEQCKVKNKQLRNSDGTFATDPNKSGSPTFSPRKARNAWVSKNGRPWPKDPLTGKNFDVHHIQKRSQGGALYNPDNIIPMHPDMHDRFHANGGPDPNY
jgi:RHS repeat-associated protein